MANGWVAFSGYFLGGSTLSSLPGLSDSSMSVWLVELSLFIVDFAFSLLR